MDGVHLMGINSGRLRGVGVRPLLAQQFIGPVTISPTEHPGTPALVIQDAVNARAAGIGLLEMFDYFGAPIFIASSSGANMYGDFMSTHPAGPAGGSLSPGLAIHGSKSPPGLTALQATGQDYHIYIGLLAPTGANYPFLSGFSGDWFWNLSGTTSTTHMYSCTSSGTPGTWTGFA